MADESRNSEAKSLEEWARHAAASDAKVLELERQLAEVKAWAHRLEDQRDAADRSQSRNCASDLIAELSGWKPTSAKYQDPLAWVSNVTGKVYVACLGKDGNTYQIELERP